jgi:hypothetical protein
VREGRPDLASGDHQAVLERGGISSRFRGVHVCMYVCVYVYVRVYIYVHLFIFVLSIYIYLSIYLPYI